MGAVSILARHIGQPQQERWLVIDGVDPAAVADRAHVRPIERQPGLCMWHIAEPGSQALGGLKERVLTIWDRAVVTAPRPA